MTRERSVGRSCPASSDDGGRDGVEGALVRVAVRRTQRQIHMTIRRIE
jgi:hypothetical protein